MDYILRQCKSGVYRNILFLCTIISYIYFVFISINPNLWLGLLNGLFHWGILTKIMCEYLFSPCDIPHPPCWKLIVPFRNFSCIFLHVNKCLQVGPFSFFIFLCLKIPNSCMHRGTSFWTKLFHDSHFWDTCNWYMNAIFCFVSMCLC